MVPGVSALSVCWPHHLSYFCPHPQIWTRKFLPVPWLLCGPRRYDSSSFKVTGGDYTFGSILPARCEQKASAQSCHPRSPRLFRAACRCHAQGCSQQVGAARWAPPLTPPCPHRSVQVLLAVLQHVHNGPHGQQRSPGSEVTRSWAERLQGDRDQLGRKLPWHSSLPRRLPRWHSAAPLGPTDPLSLQIDPQYMKVGPLEQVSLYTPEGTNHLRERPGLL